MITFIELTGFSKRRNEFFTDDDFREFQEALIENPKKGDTIANTGGFRKVRWGQGDKGKRSGVRVIYYYMNSAGRIYLALVYPKNVQENLTKEQEKALKNIASQL
ncbi:type II toxin-antitoxin system RelE/ParE family toxin [Alteromonas sp. a30]|uniref:type II toxin-antitoxin system RelE/ParE family toxin n=1 Tax=Alteromonas sp. a30 TaxID=2730917 RepID=UPI00227EADB2|nr:type II toxin-antitoxin system RelE/ParE family toxin [Alteromonas sp. a30]MCY7293818.1 type II toxin-antitoxin system RelE/ParE family toxin [Alteromonas sp. a30]